ncbi:MAG: response regulator [Planctomycetota bacterium]|nr:MAG: response regulator [Planctomycetota bacterium]
MKRVLDVGQCGMDHGSIRRLIERAFDAEVAQAHDLAGALEQLRNGSFDLVLVNRKFDADYSDGLELIKRIKDDGTLAGTPVMLVSNFADAQQQAVAVGAEAGFGKAELSAPATQERLAKFLA